MDIKNSANLLINFTIKRLAEMLSDIIVPFMRDIAFALDWKETASLLEIGWIRLTIANILLWTFVIINILGTDFYDPNLS